MMAVITVTLVVVLTVLLVLVAMLVLTMLLDDGGVGLHGSDDFLLHNLILRVCSPAGKVLSIWGGGRLDMLSLLYTSNPPEYGLGDALRRNVRNNSPWGGKTFQRAAGRGLRRSGEVGRGVGLGGRGEGG